MTGTKLAFIVFFLLLFILIQLVRMTTLILQVKKDKKLLQEQIPEEKNWEFIKGLY